MPKSFSPTIGSLYLNSEASSTLTGTPKTFSNKSFPNKPAWYAVPHATIQIFSYFDASSKLIGISSEVNSSLPEIVRSITVSYTHLTLPTILSV